MVCRVAGLVLGLLLLSGCLEEDVALRLAADGRGSMRIVRTYPAELGADAETAEQWVVMALAGFSGVEAWTDVAHEVTEEGALRLEATAWFASVGAVSEGDDGSQLRFEVRADADAMVFERALTVSPSGSYFDEDPEELSEERAVIEEELRAQLAGYRSTVTVQLPGAVLEAEGTSSQGAQEVEATLTSEELLAALEGVFEAGERLRPEVESGALTKLEADRALTEALDELLTFTRVRFAATSAVSEAFDAEYRAALAAWEGSEWRARVAEARAPVAEEPEYPAPDDLVAGEPDAFEPNDSQEEAAALTPGDHRNLQLYGEDWYRLELGAQEQVRVEVRFDHQAGDVDVALVAEDGSWLDSSSGITHRETLSYVAAEPRVVFVQVYNASSPYHLSVQVEAWTPEDRFEPNDVWEAAAELVPGVYEELVCTENDYYRVAVEPGQEVRVRLEFDHDEADLDLKLSTAAQLDLDQSLGTGDSEAVRALVRGDEVFVRVFGGSATYRMEVEVSAGPEPDAFEPNDDQASAAAIEPGRYEGLMLLGDDWYRVEVPSGHELRVQLDFEHARGDIDVSLHDAGGGFLQGSTGVSDREEVRHHAAKSEVVWVRVHNAYAPYTLTVEVEEYAAADGFEPNDASEQAKVLPVGVHEGLVRSGDDWYVVEVPVGQVVQVVARFEHAAGDVDLTLQDAEGTWLDTSNGLEDEERVSHGTGVEESLYLRVHGGEGASYRLEVSLEPWEPADAFEPNDAWDTASPITPGTYEGLQCTGEDYYTVELEAGQQLVVGVRFVHADGDLDLQVMDSELLTLETSNGVSDEEQAVVTAATTGTYYVRVHLAENTYTLTLEVR